MFSERKYEIFSIIDDNSFAGIESSEDFDDLSIYNLAYMANNCSNIEENEHIIHSEIDEFVNDFDKVKIIGDISSDFSDDDNNDYTENQNSASMRYFRRLHTWGNSSRNTVT